MVEFEIGFFLEGIVYAHANALEGLVISGDGVGEEQNCRESTFAEIARP